MADNQVQEVVILCGGKGTRLREHDPISPKPLVQIGERPMLWHIMNYYASFGCVRFILCTGYKHEAFCKYLDNLPVASPARRRTLPNENEAYLLTVELCGRPREVVAANTGEDHLTGSRLSQVRTLVHGETFFATYGDGLSDVDLGKLIRTHRQHGKLATVTAVSRPQKFGVLQFASGTGRVESFEEKPADCFVNGGFFVFESGFFGYLQDDPQCVLERQALRQAACDQELYAHFHRGFWQCMDTRAEWELLDNRWRKGDAPWRV